MMKKLTSLILLSSWSLILMAQSARFNDKHFEHNCLPVLTETKSNPSDLFEQAGQRTFPSMSWPLGNALYDNLFMMNYFDESNPFSTDGQFIDYECGTLLGYDGHTGTDITVFNFRLMDIGMPIFAAAEGVVEVTRWDEYDRHYEPPYSSNVPNVVLIRHFDDSATLYVHLRTESVGVEVGETVEKGQLLGYVGSSGSSPMPHLHIEFWGPGSTSYPNVTFRDPWEGACNAEPGLWQEQLAYVPDNPIWIMDAGITTENGAGGDAQNLYSRPFKDRAPQPLVWGADEPYMIAWVQLQSPVGHNYRIEILKPDGSLFKTSGTININPYIRYSWHPFVWSTTPINPSDFGQWTMLVYTNGELERQNHFEVGESTRYQPRFYPLAGKSLRMTGSPRIDIPEIWEFCDPVSFHLINEPNYVNLADDQVVINAPNNQPYRNEWFQLVATDSQENTDTMWYHLVDPDKPLSPVLNAVSGPDRNENFRLDFWPNPGGTASFVRMEFKFLETVQLKLYNTSGHLIAENYHNPEAGVPLEIPLGQLFSLSYLPRGIYLLEAEQMGQLLVKKVVISD